MRLNTLLVVAFTSFYLLGCAQDTPDKAEQIGAAVMAAPEEMREDATVLGYDARGKMLTLRQGTNSMICLADNPKQAGFSVACYHKDLEPFMARGRTLRAEGKTGAEVFDIREAEAKSGVLKMPSQATTLHLLNGAEVAFDPSTGTLTGANYRSVVYIPFATAESTGLPTQPMVPGGPWIMDPGTHKAHIMITPVPRKE